MDWKSFLKSQDLDTINNNIYSDLSNKPIYPPTDLIFNAFKLCTFNNTKVVILGQDPYHKKGQAMGLSFSVPKGITIPPSLKNIYKELKNEYNDKFDIPNHGDLTSWAEQGVLLLNTALTVIEGKPNSHSEYWKELTDNIIKHISDNKEHVVFILWGNNAKQKSSLIDKEKHLVLEHTHPSPLATRTYPFIGNNHFKLCNEYLKKHNLREIEWKLRFS